MARVIVVGDGPAGLSAALFLAKNGHEVVIYGQDDTPMHYAQLHNYLGLPEINGTEFQRVARAQVVGQGATISEERVDRVAHDGDAFVVDRAEGAQDRGDYLVIAGGRAAQRLVEQLGAERRDGTVVVDSAYRTDVDGLYAVGRVARPGGRPSSWVLWPCSFSLVRRPRGPHGM